MRAPLDLVIVEQVDPRSAQEANGILSFLRLMLHHAGAEVQIGVVGVDRGSHAAPEDESGQNGRTFHFLAVASAPKANRRAASFGPDALLLVIGLIKNRRHLPRTAIYQAHRIEVAAALRLLRHRYVLFLHNDRSQLTGPNSESIWRKLPAGFALLERIAGSGATRIFALSPTDYPRLHARWPQTRRLTTSFDDALFYPVTSPKRTRRNLRLVWVGRFESQKDPFLALDVLTRLKQDQQGVSLWMVGAGSLQGQLEEYAHTKKIHRDVVFAGLKTPQEVADLLRASSCLLMTSHYEASPTVLIEALACGIPVVATETADPEQLLDAHVGRRIHSRNPEHLANGVLEVENVRTEACTAAVAHRAASLQSASVVAQCLALT